MSSILFYCFHIRSHVILTFMCMQEVIALSPKSKVVKYSLFPFPVRKILVPRNKNIGLFDKLANIVLLFLGPSKGLVKGWRCPQRVWRAAVRGKPHWKPAHPNLPGVTSQMRRPRFRLMLSNMRKLHLARWPLEVHAEKMAGGDQMFLCCPFGETYKLYFLW